MGNQKQLVKREQREKAGQKPAHPAFAHSPQEETVDPPIYPSSVTRNILALQNAAGNRAVTRLIQRRKNVTRTKLVINQPGDEYEQEADRIAGEFAPPRIQRLTEQPAEQKETAPPSVDQVLADPSIPLESGLRQDMEQHTGHDFSQVRVHTDEKSAQSARDVRAPAYTVGNDIVFGKGQYDPSSPFGKQLLAHELAHVAQSATSPNPNTAGASNPRQMLHRAPETWYRGEATGVGPAKPGAHIHDFGDGLYLTDSHGVADLYAETRAVGGKGIPKITQVTLERNTLGRVLDLTTDARWAEFLKRKIPGGQTYESLIRLANENYGRFYEMFVSQNHINLADVDAIIGPEFVRGGNQICIRNPGLISKIRNMLKPVPPKGGGAPPTGTTPGEPGPEPGGAEPSGAGKTKTQKTAPSPTETAPKVPVEPSPTQPATGPEPVKAPETTASVEGKAPVRTVEIAGTPVTEAAWLKLALGEIALNAALFVVTYYLEKWHNEKQMRKFKADLVGLQPGINTSIQNTSAEIEKKAKVFPLVYANVTVVYKRDHYDETDYNEGSMQLNKVQISYQNYQTQERNIWRPGPASGDDPIFDLTFSVPLFDETAAEKSAKSQNISNYRQVRENLRYPAYKVRLSSIITLYKLTQADQKLKTLVVRDFMGMLKDEDPFVRLAAAVFLGRLKMKVAAPSIQEVIATADNDKQKKLIERSLKELEQVSP